MKIHDIGQYHKAKEEIKRLEPLIDALDNVCEIMYNNLSDRKMLWLLDKIEDLRVEYYLKHYDFSQIVKDKGKTNYEQS